APDQSSASSVVTGNAPSAQTDKEGPRDRMKDILDKLVANGTITQAQEEAILKAFKDAAPNKGTEPKHVMGDLLKLSSDYLGVPQGQVMKQMQDGKSLAEIAAATSGKSRDGLISYLVQQVTAQVDKAVADGKVTAEQAQRIKSNLTE